MCTQKKIPEIRKSSVSWRDHHSGVLQLDVAILWREPLEEGAAVHRVQVGGEAVPVPPPRFVVHSAPVRVVPVPSAEPPALVDVREAEGIPCFVIIFFCYKRTIVFVKSKLF